MPELPDVVVYIEALEEFIGGKTIERIEVPSPFVTRTFEPELTVAETRKVNGFRRLGKRIVWDLGDELFLVFHLMIAGRFHWKKPGTRTNRKVDLIGFHFKNGTLMLTEASQKKRASLHVVQGEENLSQHQPPGLEVLTASRDEFAARIKTENHTLKRTLTDPRLFSGIGNAYSDEILHEARLSPIKWTTRLTDEEISRLFHATQESLNRWIKRLRTQRGKSFPEKVTAFRTEMSVHGRHNEPCPVCQTKIQRIIYAQNETNYCPRCQTEGKILADRSLSRLLKDDWPRTIEELESEF